MRRAGFTLIEMMIYLGVLGVVLAAVASVELVARRSAASESGALIALQDERRAAELFMRDVEGAAAAKILDGGRGLELKIPAEREGRRLSGRTATIVWKLDPKRPHLVRETDAPGKGTDSSAILCQSCDGARFTRDGASVTVEIDLTALQGGTVLSRRTVTLRAVRRVDAEEKE
ncbi:MAG: type II secretion system protein [Planctomycetes bacterium]|nr:type II secretion system protein [Planctomycetota bacterium]